MPPVIVLPSFQVTNGGGDPGIGWNLATASYDSVFFGMNSQDGAPQDIAFNNDGTKMYMVGTIGTATVYEYDLGTPWVVSTAVYNSNSKVVETENSDPTGLSFKPDGTKMFMVGVAGGSRAYEYDLSTAFDVTSATYNGVNFSVGQDTFMSGIQFKTDGTKMYGVGSGGDAVYEYDLGTAWDLSTASYNSVSLSVSGQNAAMGDLAFKSTDGTKMFLVGFSTDGGTGGSGDTVYEYVLSTPWDLSTASYNSVFFNIPQDTSPNGIAFKADDGTKMYVSGVATDTVYQYTLTA